MANSPRSFWHWLNQIAPARSPLPSLHRFPTRLRRLEERLVLSATPLFDGGGFLEAVEVTGGDTVTISVDTNTNELVLYSANDLTDTRVDLSLVTGFSVRGDFLPETVIFSGTDPLTVNYLSVESSIYNVEFHTSVDVNAGDLSISAENDVLVDSLLINQSGAISIEAGHDISMTTNGILVADDLGSTSDQFSVSLNAGNLLTTGEVAVSGSIDARAVSGIVMQDTGVTAEILAGNGISISVDGDDALVYVQANVTIQADAGNISIVADDLTLDGTINAPGQTVVIQPFDIGEAIDLGATVDAAERMELSADELSRISADHLLIGNLDMGQITVSDDVSLANVDHLLLQSGVGVSGSAGSVTVSALEIQSLGDVLLSNANNDVDTFSVLADGNIEFADLNGFDLLSVAGFSTVTPPGDVILSSGGQIALPGDITAVGDISISMGGNFDATPFVFTSQTGSLTLAATGTLSTLDVSAPGNVSLQAGGDLFVDGTIASMNGAVSVASATGAIHITGTVDALLSITIDGATTVDLDNAVTTAGGVTLTGTTITLLDAATVCAGATGISVTGDLTTAADLLADNGPIAVSGTTTLTDSVRFDSHKNDIGNGATIALAAVATGGHAFTLDAGPLGDITVSGAISGGGALVVEQGDDQSYQAINVDSLTIQDATTSVTFNGAVNVTNAVAVTSQGTITQQTALDSNTSTVTYEASGDITVTGPLSAATGATLNSSAGAIDVQSTLTSATGDITATAFTTLSIADAVTATTGNVALSASGDVTTAAITAGQSVAVESTGANVDITGLVDATGDATLTAAGTLSLFAAQAANVLLEAGGAITSGAITATQAVTVRSTGSAVDLTGVVDAGTSALVEAAGAITTTAITADTSIDMTSTGASITAIGAIDAGTSATLTAATDLTTASVNATANNATLSAGGAVQAASVMAGQNVSVESTSSTVEVTGSVDAGNDAMLTAATDLTTSAIVNATNDVTMSAGAAVNVAEVAAGRDVTIESTGASVTAAGAIDAGHDATLTALTDLALSDALDAGNQASLLAGGDIDLTAAADISAGVGGIDIQAAAIRTAGDLTTAGGDVSVTGPVQLTGDIAITTTGGDLLVTGTIDGTVDFAQSLTVNTDTGNFSVTGDIGATTPLANLVIVKSADATFNGAVIVDTFDQQDSTGTTTFNGPVETFGAGGFSVSSEAIVFAPGTSSLDTHGQNATLTANALTLPDTFLNATGATVTLQTLSPATQIGIENAALPFNVTQPQLDAITAANLVIGSATNTGGISIAVDAPATINIPLTLLTGGDVDVAGDLTMLGATPLSATIGGDLNVASGATVTTDAGLMDLDVTGTATVSGAIESQTGDIQLATGNLSVIGSVTSVSGAIELVAVDVVTISGMVTTVSGDISVSGENVVVAPGANASGSLTSMSGAINLVATDTVTINGLVQTDSSSINITGDHVVVTAPGANASGSLVSVSGPISVAGATTVEIAGSVETSSGPVAITGGDIGISGDLSTVTGDIDLIATQNLNVTGEIASNSGMIDLTADRDITLGPASNIETQSTPITVTAGAGADNQGGITMADGAVINGGGGQVSLLADQNITLGQIVTPTGTGSVVEVTSNFGAIVDGGDTGGPDIIADQVALTAATGIGAGNAIDTQVTQLAANNTGTGDVGISNTGGQPLSITTVAGVSGVSQVGTVSGDVSVANDASIIIADAVTNPGGGITLVATGATADIVQQAAIASTSGSGDVTLIAGRDILLADTPAVADVQTTGTGEITLDAGNDVVFPAGVLVQSGTGQINDAPPVLINVQTPQLTAQGEAIVRGDFGRPGEKHFFVTIDWSDGTVETFEFTDPGHFEFHHFYTANPNVLNPSAPIPITVTVNHDPQINVRSLAASQDATAVLSFATVPGDGLASFPFDLTPPVTFLTFPDPVRLPDLQQPAAAQVASSTGVDAAALASEDAVSSEREVILEVLGPDGSVLARVKLAEGVLDDLPGLISGPVDGSGGLPDGGYRFLLKEPGDTRERVLMEIEVRDHHIVDENAAEDRPPSSKAVEPPAPAADVNEPEASAPGAQVDEPVGLSGNDAESPRGSDPNTSVATRSEFPNSDSVAETTAYTWHSPTARRAWETAGRTLATLANAR